MGALMERWVELDADAAAALLARRPDRHDDLRGAFIWALGQHEPGALIRWAQQLPPSEREHAHRGVAHCLSGNTGTIHRQG
jgi:hypothetical protein